PGEFKMPSLNQSFLRTFKKENTGTTTRMYKKMFHVEHLKVTFQNTILNIHPPSAASTQFPFLSYPYSHKGARPHETLPYAIHNSLSPHTARHSPLPGQC